jgi:WD40 repeat protein
MVPPCQEVPETWAVELRLLDEYDQLLEEHLTTELGRSVALTFGNLENGAPVFVEGRAIGTDGRAGPWRRAWTIPGIAPVASLVYEQAEEIQFSPDSTRLLMRAVTGVGEGPWRPTVNLVLLDIDSGDSSSLTDLVYSYGNNYALKTPIWSPDGSRIAFAYTASETAAFFNLGIHLIELNAAPVTERRLLDGLRHGIFPFWLQGKNAIDFFESNSDVTSTSGGDITQYSWSRLSVTDATVQSIRVFPSQVVPMHADVTGDGNLLVYNARESGEHFLVVQDTLSLLEIARFAASATGDRGFRYPCWSPDGLRIAAGAELSGRDGDSNYNVWVLDLATERWTPLTGYINQLQLSWITGLDWSADGRYVAVSGVRMDEWLQGSSTYVSKVYLIETP